MRSKTKPVPNTPPVADAIVVRVNRLIADLVPGYLAGRREEVVEIHRLLEARDLAALQVIGHQLKGSGEAYGFREITLLGAQIEGAAAAEDVSTIRLAAERLDRYLRSVSVVPDE